jgi:hypothetical protein
VLGGFDLAGNAFWGAVSVVMGFIGGLVWGVVARYLGMALARAGVPSVESVDDRDQGQGSYA